MEKKPNIPILATGGDVARGNYTAITLQLVANSVTGITLPNMVHVNTPRGDPNFHIKQIL